MVHVPRAQYHSCI